MDTLDNLSFDHSTSKYMEISAKNGTLSGIKNIIQRSCSKGLMIAIKHDKYDVIKYFESLGVTLTQKQLSDLILKDRIFYSQEVTTNEPLYSALKLASRTRNTQEEFDDEQLELFYKVYENTVDYLILDYYIIKIIIKTYKKEEHLIKLIKNTDNVRLLNCSITTDNINFIEAILKNTEFSFSELNNALLIAVETKRLSIFNQILNCLNEVCPVEYDDDNLLHFKHLVFACQFGYLDIAKMFIEEKKTSITYHQNYLIRLACEKGNMELVKYFISKGVDPKMYNNSCIKRAIINKHYHLIEYLLSIGCNPTRWIKQVITTEDLGIISLLEHNGYSVIPEEYAMIHAVESLNYRFIEYLIEKGADISIRSHYPLRYTAAKKRLDIVNLLLSNGGDIHQALNHGTQVLRSLASEFLKNIHKGIFQGPLPLHDVECAICYNTLKHTESIYQCDTCKNLVHNACQKKWNNGCVYCRN